MSTQLATREEETMIVIDVLGTPAPKGSTRAILISGRAVNVPGGSNTNRTALKLWDRSVRKRAAEVLGELVEPVYRGTAVAVELVFRLIRPAGHFGAKGLKASAPNAPATRPDVDKLARATLDSLIGLAFDDDSRVVKLSVTKLYATPGQEGARITVEEWKAR